MSERARGMWSFVLLTMAGVSLLGGEWEWCVVFMLTTYIIAPDAP